MLVTLPLILLTVAAAADMPAIDFADAAHVDDWLRHPVLGDPSFDSFEHAPGNPIHRGSPPYVWPVNGFLFNDPKSGNWYCYVGHYLDGYGFSADSPSMCTVYRSADRGASWEHVGPVFPDEPFTFEGEQAPMHSAPDVCVIHADGRYHMAFDWATANTTWETAANPPPDANSGAGYAWADKPEGPFHRMPRPIAATRQQPLLEGKYKRLYASSIIRRKSDWLVLTLTDSGPCFGWALLGMTADKPEGPYTPPVLLLHPESGRYLPPLLEYFPAFTHEGYLYAPATSVAINRNYQGLFRVPLEKAMEPAAWELHQAGSVWHAEPLEHESHGIWGQTFSGFIHDGQFHVMFPSRDSKGVGTINIASRPWNSPYAAHGFVLSGHEGPSLTVLRQGGAFTAMEVEVEHTGGPFSILWNLTTPLDANRPASGAAIHDATLAGCCGIELDGAKWRLRPEGPEGPLDSAAGIRHIDVAFNKGNAAIDIDGRRVYDGPSQNPPALPGLLAGKATHLRVRKFAVSGPLTPARVAWAHNDALLGYAQNRADWDEQKDNALFRNGDGIVSKNPDAAVKWNVSCRSFRICAPKAPAYGKAALFIDGVETAVIDFHADAPESSGTRYDSGPLSPGPHAIILRAREGVFPVDVLETEL